MNQFKINIIVLELKVLEKKLETAVEEEDFAQCSALTKEIEGLAEKKAQAEATLN